MAISTANYIAILSDLDAILQNFSKHQVLQPRTPGTMLFSKSVMNSATRLDYDNNGDVEANFHNLNVLQNLTDALDLKDEAVDTIKSIRDKIQDEHDNLSDLTSADAANNPNLYLSCIEGENCNNFFADLKKLKQLISQIPLDLNARTNEIQQFAASCLKLITKLMNYNQEIMQHLQMPVKEQLIQEEEETNCGANLKCSFKPHCMMS